MSTSVGSSGDINPTSTLSQLFDSIYEDFKTVINSEDTNSSTSQVWMDECHYIKYNIVLVIIIIIIIISEFI